METTAFDTRSSLNPQGGLALLVKALAKLSVQANQPGGDSLFAGILGQKISQATLLGSTSDPTTVAPGGKHLLPAATKGVILNGNGEPTTGGKVKGTADDHPPSLPCNNEPLKGIAGETAPLAGSTGEKSFSLTEKAEPTEDAKTAIHLAKAIMEQAIAIPATGESAPPADPSPTENATRQIAPPYGPDAALFAQAAGTLQRKNDGPATDGAPAKNPAAVAAAAPVASADPVSHKNLTAASPAAPATPASREVRPLSDRHADHRSPLEGAGRRTEQAFVPRPAETLQMKNDGPATNGAPADVRQTSPSHHDHWKRAGESKEGAAIAAASQKPVSAASNGEAMIGQAAPERMTPGGSPDKTLLIRDAVTETPGPAHDHQQRRNTTPNHPMRLPERDMFPFRIEMPNVVSPQETHAPATVDSTGVDMQAVIDQILEARQGSGNDFGRIRILLNPPNLGSVDLDIVVRRERVDVVMMAENATVQQALQSRGDDIRIALQRQDLKIEGFQVLLQDNGTNPQQTNSGEMYGQNRENRERFNANADVPPAFPVFSPIAGAKSAAGLVSIFA